MDFERVRRLLCRLQDAVRAGLARPARRTETAMRRVAGVTAADTIYAVDRVSEKTILTWFSRHWPRAWPVEIVMEGLEGAGTTTFPRGTRPEDTAWKCILDPIDGTRPLMYDKRSAWSLAGFAPQRGPGTTTADIVVAAMTELPTSKAGAADQLSAVRGKGVVAERVSLSTGRRKRVRVRPSAAADLRHGFGSFAKFFPADKAWIAGLEEELWSELNAGPAVFDDQYLSTGGQLYELIVGHDRFMADIRPLAPSAETALCCHPYDIAASLIATEAGCVVTAVDGSPLRVPLDTTSPVAWLGFANRALARKIAPVLRRLLAAR